VGRLSIVNEEEGLEDSRSLMTLRLQDDTLTGADEPDPDVPEGWNVTSGSVYLTRALSVATTDVTRRIVGVRGVVTRGRRGGRGRRGARAHRTGTDLLGVGQLRRR